MLRKVLKDVLFGLCMGVDGGSALDWDSDVHHIAIAQLLLMEMSHHNAGSSLLRPFKPLLTLSILHVECVGDA
jgi:hypothetical protein